MEHKNIFSKLALQVASIPSIQKSDFYVRIKNKISQVFFNWKSDRQYFLGNQSITKPLNNKFSQIKFKGKKIFYIFGAAFIVTILFIGIIRLLSSGNSGGSSDNKVAAARATTELGREFEFPLISDSGEEVSKIKYKLELAELRSEIVVKGQKATAIKGREFLIINLKITNEHNQSIEINTRDYIRLSVNKNENEWLAPDIHNDPVNVQAISTKYTRIGFPINSNDKNLVLQIGEINGSKDRIKVDF